MAVVEADDRGHYSVWTRAGRIAVTTSADGYASLVRTGNAPATLDFTLVPESILAGTVVDASTGAPVAVSRSVRTPSTTPCSSTARRRMRKGSSRWRGYRPVATPRWRRRRTVPGAAKAARASVSVSGSDGVVVRLHPAHQSVGRAIVLAKS